ncbi:MAG: YdiU family protein [Verrucomicrobia bacterium]|nr:YdiU family protein [Verrucomicrobiota bacterium]
MNELRADAARIDPSGPTNPAGWRLEHSYAELPGIFHVATRPSPARTSSLLVLNRALAAELGLEADVLAKPASADWFTGHALPPGAEPLAQAYAGHQFGGFTMLGDGRALLLGEQITPSGSRFDVQLKGAGRTPFSRRGDGRAALGPMLREYLVSEAMHALGIPTTRSLAVATTGESVRRETPLDGAVLTRVASSHLRVGTFEFAAARGSVEDLAALVEYTRRRHYPEIDAGEGAALALLRAVSARQARLIAQWLLVGFVHGVMNTDNMALSGETIDYGPCAFLDEYDPARAFSSIDLDGRYAYGRQPAIAQWNLARFAEALLPLLAPAESTAIELAQGVLAEFPGQFEGHWRAGMRAKLGLVDEAPGDADLISDLLRWMHRTEADFANTFAAFCQPDGVPEGVDPAWLAAYRRRLAEQSVSPAESLALRRAHNPAIIPRNHLVEAALTAAVQERDLAPLQRLHTALARPFEHDSAPAEFRQPAGPASRAYRTFCGT